MPPHTVLQTFGSLGDLYPYLALGQRLRALGHRVTLATSPVYRERVRAAGLEFSPLRPDLDPGSPELLAKVMHPTRGTRYVFRDLTLPHLRATYADLRAAVRGADLLVSAPLSLAAPLVAETTGVRWVSSVLAPVSLFSARDPSALGTADWRLGLGPGVNRLFLRAARALTARWAEPLQAFRLELGLGRGGNPFMEGQHSPYKVLALFSPVLAAPQPDWPQGTVATGFCFFGEGGLDPDLAAFLDAGAPPVVFTLGSAAVHVAGDFYAESLAAVQGRRAVLLLGPNPPPASLPAGVFATAYAPHGPLFARAAAAIHQGGVGTTAQAMRAGVPSLIVPFAHDQYDNAARVARLGAGVVLARGRYRRERVARALSALEGMRERAARTGERVRGEDGAARAAQEVAASLR